MATHAELDRIRDHFPADQRAFHALMAHGDAVGHGNGVEAERRAAARHHALARPVGLLIERGVARRRVIAGRRQRHEWLGNVLFLPAHRIIIAAMRRALDANGDVTAGELGLVERVSHGWLSSCAAPFQQRRRQGKAQTRLIA